MYGNMLTISIIEMLDQTMLTLIGILSTGNLLHLICNKNAETSTKLWFDDLFELLNKYILDILN